MKINYPLAQSTWDDKEIKAIQRVIDSDQYSMGSFVEEYEKRFADFFGTKYCVMTSSGSTANLLMIASLFFVDDKRLRLQRGDEVIVPAVSWSTTYYPLQQYGLKLIFVDIDKETLNFDLDALEKSISSKTKAILAVNLLGNPNDFNRIKEISSKHSLFLLEDNCESMGSLYAGRYSGTFGEMGSFSSFFSHHISTMEGGCLITNNEQIYHILLSLRAHGWTRNLPDINTLTKRKSSDQFEESFKFILPGYNVRPLEMSGSIGIEQLKKLPYLLKGRQENATVFKEAFFDHNIVEIQKELGTSSWFGFALILKENAKVSRAEIIKQLTKAGVECRPIVTGNFLKHEVMEYINHDVPFPLTNADHIDKNGFFIGNNHIDAKKTILQISDFLNTF
tara:strand:- start:1617 stop:2795 length:1179 start_codon:yes stop_codon:yes gene_type:complete